MTNNLLQLKIKQRTNKLSSNDYESFECWMIVEAFNKAQNSWVREEAAKGEATTQNVDDLQSVVKEIELVGSNKPGYFESNVLPKDYFAFKRISAKAITDDCPTPRRLVVFDAEESNVDTLHHDTNRRPSFNWAETFRTIISNQVRIYTDGVFTVVEPRLIYYRKPRQIAIDGCVDEYDVTTSDIECEFKDDITEMLIDRTAALLAGDIELFQQMQRLTPPRTK